MRQPDQAHVGMRITWGFAVLDNGTLEVPTVYKLPLYYSPGLHAVQTFYNRVCIKRKRAPKMHYVYKPPREWNWCVCPDCGRRVAATCDGVCGPCGVRSAPSPSRIPPWVI